MHVNLTEANFLLYAAQHYDSVFPDTVEFYEDLKRIVYIKRLFNMYTEKNELKHRLIINHLIVLYNVFGDHATPMLFLKLEGYEVLLKTFLVFINRMPEKIESIGIQNRSVYSQNIKVDPVVWDRLKSL